MNINLAQVKLENVLTKANYQIRSKDIWKGIFIFLIVHKFINH